MPRITPHLWFDKEAVEAAEFYKTAFPDAQINSVSEIHDTPSGDVDVVSFELLGQPFQAISAGPLFKFTPAISFVVRCRTIDEVDALWGRLSDGGNVMMPIDSYPFSDRYGWTADRFGISWQVMHDAGEIDQAIAPALMFVGDLYGKAEEAVGHYTSVFPDSKVGQILRYGEGQEPDDASAIQYVDFTLGSQRFSAMDSARVHDFGFNEAISLIVPCDTQDEIDYYWDRLSAVPESEQCGWLKDRFGVSWQIVPTALGELMGSGTEEQTARVTQAFLEMKKFDIAGLQRAFDGADA
jgi:predicted 3-demethylubiquinone-9 3-methyltransferase (glyoxalase superfamily)